MDTIKKGKLKIHEYKGKKGEYFITHILKKPFFVILRGDAKNKLLKRVNLKTEKPYYLYEGEYKIINDLVFI